MKKLYTLIVVVLTFSACSEDSSSNEEKPDVADSVTVNPVEKPPVFEAGKVYYDMRVKNSIAEYSFYIPTHQDTAKRALLIFFDSHGRGRLPVSKYTALADSFNFILAGANSVKNNMPLGDVHKSYSGIKNDIKNRFGFDGPIFVAGFSGGARYATTIPTYDSSVTAVIGIGAGFAQTRTPRPSYKYMGIVGKEDFNYVEMTAMEKTFAVWSKDHYVYEHNGGHEWPNELVMSHGLLWLHNHLIGSGLRERNNEQIAAQRSGFRTEFFKDRRYLEQVSNANAKMFVFAPLKDYTKVDGDGIMEWFSRDQIKHLLSQRNVARAMEVRRRNKLSQKLSEKDTTWWKSTVGNLRKPTPLYFGYQEEANIRVLKFLGLQGYFLCGNAFKSNDDNAATIAVRKYELFDPENAYVWFFKAKLAARSQKENMAVEYLSKAAELEFDDPGRIETDQDFDNIRHIDGFNKSLEKIKAAN